MTIISNGCLQLMKWFNHAPLHTVFKETERAISLVFCITRTAQIYGEVVEIIEYFLGASWISLFFFFLWISGRSNVLVRDTPELKLAQSPYKLTQREKSIL